MGRQKQENYVTVTSQGKTTHCLLDGVAFNAKGKIVAAIVVGKPIDHRVAADGCA
jgi:hypothetical protein